jgi:hypothetical protein
MEHVDIKCCATCRISLSGGEIPTHSGQHHRGREPPVVSVQDEKATCNLFQKAFCRVDWRLFDPATVSLRFHRGAYEEQLRRLT